MTKIYIKPETKTIKVELQLLQQTSLGKYNDPNDDTTQVTDEGDVLSRGFSFFFDEENETEE